MGIAGMCLTASSSAGTHFDFFDEGHGGPAFDCCWPWLVGQHLMEQQLRHYERAAILCG
jgi:hypothetical protein